MKIDIVNMTLAHIDDVMIIEELSFALPWSRKSFTDELTANRFAMYFCAVEDGRVCGYAGMWKVFDEGHITNIAVHPEYRNKGIGRLLVEYLDTAAMNSGIERLTLEVRKSNHVARSLYEKVGFEACGERKGYYSDNGENAVIMWKDVKQI
jgi:ribosomal-protein-alanine N-acetyltransferase